MISKRVKDALKHSNKVGTGARARKKLVPKEKVQVVMEEFKRGTLHDSAGNIVTDRKKAIAIAMSEANLARKKKKRA